VIDRADGRAPRRRWRGLTGVFPVALLATAILGACSTPAGPAWAYPPTPAPGTQTVLVIRPPASPLAPASVASPDPAASLEADTTVPSATVAAVHASVRVPILYYHRIIAPPRGFRSWSKASRERFLAYDVIPAAFEAQLDWLVANGYTTILPRDLAAYWDDGTPLPERPVMITFDDGTHDWASTVLTMLQERGMVAEFYVTMQSIPRGGMTWGELRRLAAAGMGIGAHGLHHVQLTGAGIRRPASEAVMRREVEQPRKMLEAKLGIVPDSWAYVGGGFDSTLRRLVSEAGYTTARSIIRGRVQDPDQRYLLRVLRVGSRMDVTDVVRGRLVPGLPEFTRLMRGAS
jgi:peptidoglycan/xylan/chitin deacetylase (PgdA/CDA1 family)